jgi:hypothetical protein
MESVSRRLDSVRRIAGQNTYRPATTDKMAANLVLRIESTAHGMTAGTVMAWDGSDWILADAATVTPSTMLGVIGSVPDADSYLLVAWGLVAFTGLSVGTYWLDQATPGQMTDIEPAEDAIQVLRCMREDGLCIVGIAIAAPGLTEVDWTDVTNKPDEATRWPAWTEVTSKPSTFAPSAHGHPWSEISSKPDEATRWPAWSEVTSKPTEFTPEAHDHDPTEIEGVRTNRILCRNQSTPTLGPATDVQIAEQGIIARVGTAVLASLAAAADTMLGRSSSGNLGFLAKLNKYVFGGSTDGRVSFENTGGVEFANIDSTLMAIDVKNNGHYRLRWNTTANDYWEIIAGTGALLQMDCYVGGVVKNRISIDGDQDFGSASRALSLREVNVVDSTGAAKKIVVLASAEY